MKISYMQKRENFDEINKKTLAKFYKGEGRPTVLYIYPELNTIVTAAPSRKVKKYIYTEFSVNSSVVKKLLAGVYSRVYLNSRGALAAQKITVTSTADENTLIYPCNKKYRIFDFSKNEVSVIVKDGFCDNDLKKEISFRERSDIPDFVLKIKSIRDGGYSEEIIDGRPLARISDGFERLRNKAYRIFTEYAEQTKREISGAEYSEKLRADIDSLAGDKVRNKTALFALTCKLLKKVASLDKISLCFSHGDLQAGNIWVENKTNKIYIIDWESWGERSVWYDRAVLFNGLRPRGAAAYLSADAPFAEQATVLCEDIVFNLNELDNLPNDYGEEQFEAYIGGICEQIKTK